MKKIIFTLCLLLVSGLVQAKEFKITSVREAEDGFQIAFAFDKDNPSLNVLVSNSMFARKKMTLYDRLVLAFDKDNFSLKKQRMKLYDGLVIDIKTPIVVRLYALETTNKNNPIRIKTDHVLADREALIQLITNKQIKTFPVLADKEALIQRIKEHKEHLKAIRNKWSKKEIEGKEEIIADLERQLKEAQPYQEFIQLIKKAKEYLNKKEVKEKRKIIADSNGVKRKSKKKRSLLLI